jgi:uncharacterized protein YajQ (UPF0234 family)
MRSAAAMSQADERSGALTLMPQDHCFDVVSKVNLQEARNAIAMAQKEISTRFDFRGSNASVEFDESAGLMNLTADDSAQLNGVRDVLQTKLSKRGVSLKAFAWEANVQLPSGGMKVQAKLQQGLSSDNARRIVKAVKDLGLKVQPRIDGESVRVSAKQIDDLQSVIQALKAQDFGVPIQMENYR